MNGARQRLLVAGLLALGLHGTILSWQLAEPKITLPRALAVQSISVSLEAREEIKNSPPPPAELKPPPPQKESAPMARTVRQPPRRPPTPVPLRAPQPQTAKAGQPKQQAAASQEERPQPPQSARQQRVSSTQPEKKSENSQPPTPAARVIQQATPLYRLNPPPAYPRQARRRGLEGVVLLEARIDTAGRVSELRIFTSSGQPILDRAALKAVRRWRFRPGYVGHKRQEMWVKVPVRFQLQ